MPKKEEYGAQPPIELIRQWMDHAGWYNRAEKEKPFMTIQDIIFCSSMGPPGSGREPLTQRLQRHYNIMAYTDLGPESIIMIFDKILSAFIGHFSTDVKTNLVPLVQATLNVFNGVAEKLRPTPSKSHYTFNLRDISKIFSGVSSADQKQTQDTPALLRLWVHEAQRVFGDRMINTADKGVLLDLLVDECIKLKVTKDTLFNAETFIFGYYFNGIDGENRPFIQIQDIPKMIEKIEEYLEDYNSSQKHPMKLVMFLEACDHVSRICRVLR
jgi:dynein heavy chain